MGLDQYAFATKATFAQAVDFEEREIMQEGMEELHYWRKHPNLHGWMEALYHRKGGCDPEFNSSPLALTAADLERLEADIKANRLPETEGFFFGNTDGSESDDDLEFVASARAAITAGKTVFYIASW